MTIEPAPPPISRDWTLWVSENMLRDCSPASMLETMVGAGVNEKIALRCIQMVTASPIMQAARRHQQLTEKLESVMLNQSKLQQFDPKFKAIDRRSGLSTQEL